MPLSLPSPPGGAWDALTNGLRDLREAQQLDPLGGNVSLNVPAVPVAMKPHPVYVLGLEDLENGKGLEAAREAAWRYLLVANNQVEQAAEVVPAPGGGNQLGSVTKGHVAGTEQALAVAENLPFVQKGSYEVRALRVPALYVLALWLKDLQGNADHLIVVPPTFPPLQPLTAYTASDLLAILQQRAQVKAPLERNVVPHDDP